MQHDLHTFLKQAADEMASEYQRIYANAASDPGTAGDEGERNWQALFRNWLPPSYHVATKGRLINERGDLSRQIDLVVLKPGYPPGLRDKAIWLAGGVAAAFECKNTLTAANVKDAVERASEFKKLFRPALGTPRSELKSQLFFGLLAHSHNWKSEGSKPDDNIRKALEESSVSVDHPRYHLDTLCVSDVGLWRYQYMPCYKSVWQIGRFEDSDKFDLAMSVFSESTTIANERAGIDFHPIGGLIQSVVRHIGWTDHSLRDIASYYGDINLGGTGGGTMRPWRLADVYSAQVAAQVEAGRVRNSEPWDEWSMTAGVI